MVFGFDAMITCSDTVKKVNMQSIVNDCIDFAFLDFYLLILLFRISQVASRYLTYWSELIWNDIFNRKKKLFKTLPQSKGHEC